MEVDITDFITNENAYDYSGSRAERGDNAAQQTWGNAMVEAARKPMLTTEEQLQALRDHVQAMGFGAEVQTYPADQCNALFIQLISGDMREAGMDDSFPDEFDWKAYEERQSEGHISGNIFRCDIPGHESFGRIFYQLSD